MRGQLSEGEVRPGAGGQGCSTDVPGQRQWTTIRIQPGIESWKPDLRIIHNRRMGFDFRRKFESAPQQLYTPVILNHVKVLLVKTTNEINGSTNIEQKFRLETSGFRFIFPHRPLFSVFYSSLLQFCYVPRPAKILFSLRQHGSHSDLTVYL